MPRAPDLAGCVLDGRYELRELIGEGTFGRVYAGFDRRLQRAVAVKVIKPWWAEDPAWAERFEREAQLLASVSDPGIVQIFDVGHAEEGVYYVAELIEGESLAQRLKRGPLAPASAARVAEELCRGLARAHAERVVHRDVKPANILIDRSGRVKVSDFGVARLADASPHGAAATALGSPRYMSPEQASGQPTSPASDVYGVGVVLYEMLAGRPPFEGEAAVEVAVRHLRDAPPPLPGSVPPELAAVVGCALAKDPEERYADGAAMADALSQARASLPADAREIPGEDPGEPRAQDTAATSALPLTAATSVATAAGATTVMPSAAETTVLGAAKTTVEPSEARTTFAPPVEATTRMPSADPTTRIPPADATTRMPPAGADATHIAPPPAPPAPPRRRGRIVWPLLLIAALIVVAIVVLARSPQTTVPELRGLSRDGVRARAGRHELKPRFDRRYSSSTPRGVSLSQEPEPGDKVGEGSTVRVTLSDGPAPVDVPDVKGENLDAARQELDAVGLRASVRESASASGEPGTVLRQSPAPPGKAVPGTAVTLTVVARPSWHTVTSFAALDDGRSVPFRIRGERWRVVYRMAYQGRCQLLVICFGPAAQVVRMPTEERVDDFDLDKGAGKTHTIDGEPGVYQVSVAGGDDPARWSMSVQDWY